MSRTIDEKVVEMRFDNSDFERNVTQSMSTLDKLKGALDFSGASKAFDGITSAANKVDLGGLTGAFDGVHEKVTNLEKVINGFFENVGRRLSNFAIDQVKGVTLEPVMKGFSKYEQKSKAVQTIMNATGQSIEDVSAQLEKLLWYTDETSYDFAEMVTTVGKFTSSGVDLERSVTAMQAIGNWAAVSGAEKQQANMAMYNLAQALGMGFVGAADYRSIMNANMDTREFKQMVIDEAIKEGTLAVQTLEDGTEVLVAMNKETKELIYENEKEGKLLEVNADNFYSTLTKGKWFDRDVLLNVTDKYGRFSDLMYQFYNDVIDNGFEVTTSELIAYVDAYRDGTLDMNDAIKETGLSAEYLTDVLTQLSSEEFELSEKAFKAGNEARTFKDAIDATKDAVSTAWMSMLELLFGNYEEAKVLWTDLSNELWDIFAGPINDINDLLSSWREIELDDGTILDGRDDFINGIKDIYHALRSVVDPITEAWQAIFPPIDEFKLYDITKKFHDFTSGLVLDETRMNQVRMVFEDLFDVFKTFSTGFTNGGGFGGFLSGFGNIIENVSDKVYNFFLGIQRIRGAIADYESGNLSEFSFVQQTIDAYPAAAKALEIYEKLVKTAETLGRTFGKIFDTTKFFKDGVLTIDSIISGIETNIANILGAISEIVHIWTGADIGKTVDNIRAILFGLFDGIKAFLGSERWAEVKYAISGIATAFKEAFGPAWQAAVTIFDDWIAGIRTLISGADGDFNGFFDTIVRGAYAVAGFVRSWKDGIQFISDFLVRFLSLTDAIEVYQANGGGILGILAVINDKIGIIIDTFADLVQNVTGFDIHGIGDGILSVIQGIDYAILQLADTIAKVFGWKDNPFGKLLGQIDSEYTGFDGISVNLVGVFQRIGDAFSKLGDIFNAVSPGISSALSGVKVVLLDVIQFFKDISADMSFPDLLHLIMQVITVFSGIKLAKKAGEMFEAIGDALTSWQKTLKVQMLLELAGAILMIAGAAVLISKIDNDKIGLVLGTLGVAFGGLIGVLAVSRAGNADNLKALPGIIISVAGAMVVLSFAAGKLADVVAKFGAIENFWDAFSNFAATLVTISILIAALAGLNAKLTAKDGLTNTNVINGIVASISKLAIGMLLLAGVIKLYEVMDFWKIAEGLGKIFGTLAAAGASMGVAERLFNFISTFKAGGFTSMESTATSMLKFAGAVAVLAVVAGALTLIDWPDLGNSLLKMIAIVAAFSAAFAAGLVIIGGALAVLQKLNIVDMMDKIFDVFEKIGNTIWKFAKSIAILAGITIVIGLIEEIFGVSLKDLVDKGLEVIEYAIHSLSEKSATIAADLATIIVDIIREALRVLAENIPEITQYLVEILGGLIKGVKDAMAHGDLNIWEALGGAGLFAGILGLVVFLKKNKVGVRDFGAAALAIGGAALLILEMGVLFAAMGYVGDAIGGVEGLKKMQEFASGIVHVFTDDWGVLALFGVLMAFELLMAKFGDKFGGTDAKGNKYGGTKGMFKGFLTAGALIASVVGLVDELGALFTVTGLAIEGIEMIPGVKDGAVVTWIEKAGEFFAAIAKVFGEEGGGVFLLFASMIALEALFSKMKVNAGETWSAFGTVISVLAQAELLIDALGALFAVTGLLIEGIEMIPGVKDGGIVTWIEKAGDVFQAIGAAIGKLVGGLAGGIAGAAAEETLKGVGDGLAYIGDKAGGFFELMANLDQSTFEGFKNFGEMAESLGKASILDAIGTFLGGKDKYKDFADGIVELGPGIAKFAGAVEGVDVSTVEKAGVCASIITALAKDVPNDGGVISWFTGDNNIATFGANLAEFGKGLYKYAFYVKDVDTAAVDATSSSIATLAEIAKDLPNEGGLVSVFSGNNDFKTFGENLASFGASLFTYSAYAVQTNNNIGALTSVGKVVESLGDAATVIDSVSSVKDITKFGENVVKFGNKLKEYGKIASEINVDDVNAVTSAVTNILDTIVAGDSDTFNSKIEEVGSKILDGVLGLFGTADSEKKTKEASDKILTYICDKFKENASVSKFSVAITKMVSDAIGEDELKEGLKTAGSGIVTEIQNGITESFEGEEGLSVKFASFLESLLASVATDGQNGTKTRYYNAGADLIKSLMNGMLNEEKISGFGSPAALQLKEGFKALLDSLIGLIVSEEMRGQFNRGGASLINSLLSGMKSVDVAAETNAIGKNATLGVSNGMVDEAAMAQVKKNAAQVMNTATNTMKTEAQEKSPSKLTTLYGWYLSGGLADGLVDGIPMVVSAVGSVVDETKEAFTKSAERGGFDIHSNSWLTTLFGRFIDGGLADGLIDGIPGIQAAIDKVKQSITDKMGLNDLMNLLHENGLGALENTFADYVAQYGADFDIEGQMADFHDQYVSSMEDISIDGAESFMAPYTEGSYATDGTTVFMNDVGSTLEGYNGIRNEEGAESVYSYFDGAGDAAISAAESITPTMNTAGEIMGNAVAEPVEERLAEMLTYAEWVAKQYPEGLTKELSAPVFDFDDLYENMKGGELEAILNMFDAMDETGRRNLIRAYGLGEEGGNADLASYLQWYWNNEPTRMQNLESIKKATEGYQAYLDEQKALQEAQTIQSQKNYEGVQQIAADMQTQTDEANARHLAYLAEIKMDVAALREELSGVHADIAELNNMDVYIDSSALVGATAEKYNEELGNMAKIGRRRVTR